ncbi:MAG: hypothetical protein ISS63_03715 [Desulfobacteraceae bacterium]|nr:hypothetical protein [Desulfobacteraceae bacterium]
MRQNLTASSQYSASLRLPVPDRGGQIVKLDTATGEVTLKFKLPGF